ncbi:MAG: DNA glycosylase [Oscillospiraceae bacterium]
MKIRQDGSDLVVTTHNFSLVDTLDCGQCFRWWRVPSPVLNENIMTGVVANKLQTISQTGDQLVFFNTTSDEFYSVWQNYFDFSTNYDAIKLVLCKDETINKACEYAGGIRLLRQDPWETLASFIISQNNNIPRIKSSIKKLCATFGEQISDDVFTFPTAQKIAHADKSMLSSLSLGYRDDYLLDCSTKIASGQIELEKIFDMDLALARETLRKIKGVGPKVAECALLFGFYKMSAFPVDTWMKKALSYFYSDGFPEFASQYAGIAQQYIFHYIRTCKDAIPTYLLKK